MATFHRNLKWGCQKPPAPPLEQLGFTKILFNEPEMPSINVHHLLVLAKTSAKNGFIFLEAILDFSPSHKYLHLGNLNPINILKCPNNLEGIFRLLRIISKVPQNIFRIFPNEIVFLLFQNTETEIKK